MNDQDKVPLLNPAKDYMLEEMDYHYMMSRLTPEEAQSLSDMRREASKKVMEYWEHREHD